MARVIQIAYVRPHWEIGFEEGDGSSIGVQFNDPTELLLWSGFSEEERHTVLEKVKAILDGIAGEEV
jgi:hypothetical protein